MGKDIEKKLEELIDLLKKLLSKREEAYRPRRIYRIPKPKVASGYRLRPRSYNYPTYRNLIQKHKLKSNPKPEKSSGIPKPSSEQIRSHTKERLVYDPEVRRLLRQIEKNLRSEPNEEELLKQLESNPELYDRISKILAERAEPYEEAEAEEYEEPEDLEEIKNGEPANEGGEGGLEVDAEAGQNGGESVEVKTDDLPESFEQGLNDEEPLEPANEVSENLELQAQPVEDFVEPYEEPSLEVIEQIEAQDLSSLEEELYQEPELLEPIEPIEPEQESEPLEAEAEGGGC